jgi:hypothetical protein
MLRRAREVAASEGEPVSPTPAIAEEALIGGASAIVAAHLGEGRRDELPAVAPEISQLILAPFIGAERARESIAAPPLLPA